MANGISAFGQGKMEVIPIHFDVPNHYLPLKTFIETAVQTEEIITTFNEQWFDGKLEYELLVLPPKPGTFLSPLAISVVGGVSSVWLFLESSIGKGFIKGLTDHDPRYWAEIVGQKFKQKFIGTSGSIETEVHDDKTEIQKLALVEAVIVAEVTKSFLQKSLDELQHVGVPLKKMRNAFQARNSFYKSCSEDREIKAIGFDETENFPIKRSDFIRLHVMLPPKEEELEHRHWQSEITFLKVTSPNWDREDTQRQWKGRDSNGRERFFVIMDEEFWSLVKEEELNPHIIDTIKVQWAYHLSGGKITNARVLRVLKFNDEHLADPLDDNALSAILGRYDYRLIDDAQTDLFDGR